MGFRFSRWFGAGLALLGLHCDVIGQAASAAGGAQSRTPRRCDVCNGTGSITQSANEPLTAVVTRCAQERSGFLGLGSDEILTMGVRNDSDTGGNFELKVLGDYPGGGSILHANETVHIEPHAEVVRRIRYHPSDGMTGTQCRATPPVVVVQHTAVCPRCNGQGIIR